MGASTPVVVTDSEWRFDPEHVFDALLVVDAPAAQMLALVAWARAYVPADVDLVVYDNDTFDVRPLPHGTTEEQLAEDYWPDAIAMEEESRKLPPTEEERWRATKPPHLP